MATKVQEMVFAHRQKQSQLAIQMNFMEVELREANLWQTARMLNEAKKMMGYEMAGTPDLYKKIEDGRQRDFEKRNGSGRDGKG